MPHKVDWRNTEESRADGLNTALVNNIDHDVHRSSKLRGIDWGEMGGECLRFFFILIFIIILH